MEPMKANFCEITIEGVLVADFRTRTISGILMNLATSKLSSINDNREVDIWHLEVWDKPDDPTHLFDKVMADYYKGLKVRISGKPMLRRRDLSDEVKYHPTISVTSIENVKKASS